MGIIRPASMLGKMIYRNTCDCNLSWDKDLPNDLMKCWKKWREKLPNEIEVPKSLFLRTEEIQAIDLRALADSSGQGTSAAARA